MFIKYQDFRSMELLSGFVGKLRSESLINIETLVEDKMFRKFDTPRESGLVGEWIDVKTFRVWYYNV